jgi:hypothetical protein
MDDARVRLPGRPIVDWRGTCGEYLSQGIAV